MYLLHSRKFFHCISHSETVHALHVFYHEIVKFKMKGLVEE